MPGIRRHSIPAGPVERKLQAGKRRASRYAVDARGCEQITLGRLFQSRHLVSAGIRILCRPDGVCELRRSFAASRSRQADMGPTFCRVREGHERHKRSAANCISLPEAGTERPPRGGLSEIPLSAGSGGCFSSCLCTPCTSQGGRSRRGKRHYKFLITFAFEKSYWGRPPCILPGGPTSQ
jgi:hypothetical protein